ncbi:hybrid sensor histidine kinase/response regulator [Oscillatoriales cyanobacterium USR001]|nr:hybrid sensor histidine kinase/response regulator [Oscillatoriales cyanobacterium USR001]
MNTEAEITTKGNILIVDDTQDNLRVLSSILIEYGYKVRVAINGNLALKGVEASSPDLILLDINMPEMNGYEVCQKLKSSEKHRDIPIIFLSSLDETNDKVKAFKFGGVDYITKPIEIEEVLVRIENHLTIGRLQQQLKKQNALLQESEASQRQKSEDLQLALRNLQETQAQLVQSEKMSALGQVVAGIAHEINNPITFLSGNLNQLTQYTSNLLILIELYQKALPSLPEDIEKIQEEIDFEFFKSDLPKILTSMNTGANRIRDIVLSLRTFSRLGESECKSVDIHAGLDSTLMILQYRLNESQLRSAIQVAKEYGSLPLVECWASQVNQVFINILYNAIDALELKFQNNSSFRQNSVVDVPKTAVPTITIRTEIINSQQVAISIADNGIGMTEEVRKCVFDPFFTTKDVGSGKGLGLTICYQIIVDTHGGQISCESTPGLGSILKIVLPIKFLRS